MKCLLGALSLAALLALSTAGDCTPGEKQCCPGAFTTNTGFDGQGRFFKNTCTRQTCGNDGRWGPCVKVPCHTDPDVCYVRCGGNNNKRYTPGESYMGVFDSCNSCTCAKDGDLDVWKCTKETCRD